MSAYPSVFYDHQQLLPLHYVKKNTVQPRNSSQKWMYEAGQNNIHLLKCIKNEVIDF